MHYYAVTFRNYKAITAQNELIQETRCWTFSCNKFLGFPCNCSTADNNLYYPKSNFVSTSNSLSPDQRDRYWMRRDVIIMAGDKNWLLFVSVRILNGKSMKFYLNLLTSRPAWLLCRFINDLPLVFFSLSLASVNLLLKAEPYITLSEQPDHVNVLSSPTLDWSQPQPGSSPLEQPLVTATLTPAAVIACMYAASRVPVKQKTWNC